MRGSLFSPLLLRKSILVLLWLSLVFEALFYLFSHHHYQQVSKKMLEEIKLRVSIDLASTQIAGEIHRPLIEGRHEYIQSLNNYLAAQEWPITISKIDFNQQLLEGHDLLSLPSGVFIHYQNLALPWHLHLSVLPLLAAWAFGVFVYFTKLDAKAKPLAGAESTTPKSDGGKPMPAVVLKIDLQSRRLSHIQSGNSSDLANKPLCFYLALVQYCSDRPNVFLNQNKNLPPELLELCEKYFRRMNELGHAVRKRPDFNKNLEKTLSEIRASLDQVFVDDQDQKTVFYPRKAIGEGSRSKVHNYAPPALNRRQIEIHGL